jgi:RND family efflux transporter MFP subunit
MKYWIAGLVVLAGFAVAGLLYMTQTASVPPVRAQEPVTHEVATSIQHGRTVDVFHPAKGMQLDVEQPGSVRAFETVQLRPFVSGFLKEQKVDIGYRVKRGEVLAKIDVPEIEKQMAHNKATLSRRNAEVKQMEARVVSARADSKAANAAVDQADAAYKSATAWVRYRQLVYNRMKDLFARSSVEEKLVDEAKEKYEASLETERSAKAAIATSQANLAASIARIDQAEADVLGARAEIEVAQADLEKTQVLLDYSTITAPFDGVITRRNFNVKDFIRSASEGTAQEPLLTVQRTDLFRVVVQVPDSAVPFLDEGDAVIMRLDCMSGKKFVGKIARTSQSEDPTTRLMHIEVDLPNPTGEIKDGMYGKVKIILDQFPDKLAIPLSAALSTSPGPSHVFVVGDDGVAHRTAVRLGKSNGKSIVVPSGLRPDDRVVLNPSGLSDGVEVQAHLVELPRAPAGD